LDTQHARRTAWPVWLNEILLRPDGFIEYPRIVRVPAFTASLRCWTYARDCNSGSPFHG
jgi:hypothetical protein